MNLCRGLYRNLSRAVPTSRLRFQSAETGFFDGRTFPQHFLYFLPEPQGQGAFRQGFLWTFGGCGVPPADSTGWSPFFGTPDA